MASRLLWLMLFQLFVSFSSQAKPLRFVAEDLPPLHFTNADNRADGFLVDVAKAVIAHTELSAEFELMPQARAFESAQQEADVFMLSLLRSDTRENHFQWVGSVYQTKGYLIGLSSRDDIQLSHLDDAKKYIVGTIRGYFAETFLRKRGFDETRNLGLAVRYDHLWGMLFKGHVDLILTNAISQQIEITKAGYDPSKVKRYLDLSSLSRELHIASGLQTDAATIALLRLALEEVKAKREYQSLAEKWQIEL